MNRLIAFAFLAISANLASTRGAASVTVPAPVLRAAETAEIPFAPPLDAPLRYRWEKAVERDGKTRMSWSVSDFRFVRQGDGFRLTVTTVSSGSNETDPARLAIEKRLEKLLNFPFVLRLDASGSIQELEESDRYWSTIFRVMREELGRVHDKTETPAFQRALNQVIGLYEKMSREARLALLTESVQPLLEFGATETEVGKPIATTVDGPSAFGGTLKHHIAINLKKVKGQSAYLTLQSTVPRSELEALTTRFVVGLTKLPPAKQEEMKSGLAALQNFRHETNADYQVSLDDGMLEKFISTETIEVTDKSKSNRRVTTRSLELLN